MSTRDPLDREPSRDPHRAAGAREHLDHAAEDLDRAAGLAGEAARHAKEALKAGASGTLERTREVARGTAGRASEIVDHAADATRDVRRQAAHVAGHLADATPDRALEHRADHAAERALHGAGGALQSAAPVIGHGVETAARLTGSAMHAIAGPLAAVVGRIAGAVGGWWSAGSATLTAFPEAEEQLCVAHFEAYGAKPAELTYDTARTAYLIGYLAAQNPTYRERHFDDVEVELRHGFDHEPTQEYDTLRDFARFGYERATIIRPTDDGDRVTAR